MKGRAAVLIFCLSFEVSFELKGLKELKEFKPIDSLIPNGPIYHLSLTKTLYVKEFQKELFKIKVSEAINQFLKLNSMPRTLKCEKVSLYFNEESTRNFLAIDLENDKNILKLIKEIDSVLKSFNLPMYYEDPKLHFSVLWSRADDCVEAGKNLGSVIELEENEKVELEEIIIKCGNKIDRIKL